MYCHAHPWRLGDGLELVRGWEAQKEEHLCGLHITARAGEMRGLARLEGIASPDKQAVLGVVALDLEQVPEQGPGHIPGQPVIRVA